MNFFQTIDPIEFDMCFYDTKLLMRNNYCFVSLMNYTTTLSTIKLWILKDTKTISNHTQCAS